MIFSKYFVSLIICSLYVTRGTYNFQPNAHLDLND